MTARRDDRVKPIVQEYAPRPSVLKDSLRMCLNIGPQRAPHKFVYSYGASNRESIGLIFEICCAADGQKCQLHRKLLPKEGQMIPDQRAQCLTAVASLFPAPFGDEQFVHWCCETAVALNIHAEEARVSPYVSTPRRVRAVAGRWVGSEDSLDRLDLSRALPRATAFRATTVATAPIEVDVIVYMYHTNKVGPVEIVCRGTRRGLIVSFVLRQPIVMTTLGIPADDRKLLAGYQLYEPHQRMITRSVPPSQCVTIVPGQRLIYKDTHVNQTPWLEKYVPYTTPPGAHPPLDPGPAPPPGQVPKPIPTSRTPSSSSSARDGVNVKAGKRKKSSSPRAAEDVIDLTESEDDKPSKKRTLDFSLYRLQASSAEAGKRFVRGRRTSAVYGAGTSTDPLRFYK